MGRYGKGGEHKDHGKMDLVKIAKDRLHEKSREMAKQKPDGASMQEQIRQDIRDWKDSK